ncbi:MAG TPA: hypothetical protein PLW66_13130, partial [Saprospiraceae bacterium]|nr:hypothetical protein [Saprospiraceae bacterium]
GQSAQSAEWSARLAAAEQRHDERTRSLADRLHDSTTATATAVQDLLAAEMPLLRQTLDTLPEKMLPALHSSQNNSAEQLGQLHARLARMEQRNARNTNYLFVLVIVLFLALLLNFLNL